MVNMKTAVKIFIFNVMVGLLLFLIIEVIFGSVISDLVQSNTGNSFVLVLIVNIGFFISILISIISIFLTNELIKVNYVIILALLTYIINFIFWIIISYIFAAPYITTLSFIEKFVELGTVLVIFSSLLYSPTLLWFFSQISFSLIYVLLLFVIKIPLKKKQKNTKKLIGKWI